MPHSPDPRSPVREQLKEEATEELVREHTVLSLKLCLKRNKMKGNLCTDVVKKGDKTCKNLMYDSSGESSDYPRRVVHSLMTALRSCALIVCDRNPVEII